MREIMQFKSTKERLKYLSGGFEEVIPVEVKAEKVEEAEEKAEKPAKKTSKSKKKAKKVEEDGEVQAE